jgi:hypothetical protein
MSFLARHRVVLGGLGIGLLAGLYQITTTPSVNAGYIAGVLLASVLIFGALGGFVIWLVTPKAAAKGDRNA